MSHRNESRHYGMTCFYVTFTHELSHVTYGSKRCAQKAHSLHIATFCNGRPICNILQQTATNCDKLRQNATYATYCNTLPHKCYQAGLSHLGLRNLTHPLQHTETHCNTLQHKCYETVLSTYICVNPATYPLQHTAKHRNRLQQTATHCNTRARQQGYPTQICINSATHLLQHTATHCNTSATKQGYPTHTATHCNNL